MDTSRKVPFITLSSGDVPRKKRVEEEGGLKKDSHQEQHPSEVQEKAIRLELKLSEPTDKSCSEFIYTELVRSARVRHRNSQNPVVNPNDPFNDDEREKKEVEALARKFEAKYGGKIYKHRKDRMQDLIDIGYGYDETDPFIDNSEAYDELVPASLTTKLGGFYINTGTLQFRQASESDDEDRAVNAKPKIPRISRLKDGNERVIKKRKRKEESGERETQQKLKLSKQMGVTPLNAHKPKKKKAYKDLAEMIRKFQKEKEALLKKDSNPKPPMTVSLKPPAPSANTDISDLNLGPDPELSFPNELLQEAASAFDLLEDIDFDKLLDSATDGGSPGSECGEENGKSSHTDNTTLQVTIPKQIPPLPEGLPVSLEKRIEDLREAAKLFDEEGRKKFFTQEMNTILLDIELQLQELNPSLSDGVYSHLEAFVPCNRETLIKRLKKLHLNVQDDRLKEPLQKLKVAITNMMPEQLVRYQEVCQAHSQARFAKMQAGEDKEKNGSEEEDDEKPGKRIVGPRKKFRWDENARSLLCNLIRIKLGCYELEPSKPQSVEDYLKAFMETELKPLWPKGWMQSRMLFKESRSVHRHLTAVPSKKKVMLAPKPKLKESSPKKEQKTITPSTVTPMTTSGSAPVTTSATASLIPTLSSATSSTPVSSAGSTPAAEAICLDDSLDEALSVKPPSLESISEALAVLNNAAKGIHSISNSDTAVSRPRSSLREEKLATIMSKLPLVNAKTSESTQVSAPASLIAGHVGSLPSKPQDPPPAGVGQGLIAGSSAQSSKIPSDASSAKLLQQGAQRSSSPQVSSVSHGQVTKMHQQSAMHQNNYVSPLQATISKSLTNPVVRLTNNLQLSSLMKPQEKQSAYRSTSSSSSSSSPSSGSSPSVSHSLASRTASSPSNSSAYSSKGSGAHVTNQAFKPPFSVVSTSKHSTSPSSSSSGSPDIQSNTLHKQSGGINNNRQPSASLLGNNRSSSGQSVKHPHVTSKLTNPLSGISNKNITGTVTKSTSGTVSKSTSGTVKSSTTGTVSKHTSGTISKNTTGTVSKSSLSGTSISLPVSRSNINSSGTNHRTSGSGGTGSGITKQLSNPHRPTSSSVTSSSSAGVQSTASASLLASTSPLTLMTSPLSVTNPSVTSAALNPFGMLGGLVPVTVPFQFPLELLGFGTDAAGVTTSSGSTSTAFHHSLTQNGGQSQGESKVQRKIQ
ncbi:ubinuclein-2 isoform X2 [Protopterus annectens]|uniref:ubinuclein-2 isoform X2 n=1 Tax=Protopterus annectens TaxID=7888 RepID=UPI001CFAE966|nr:ubinuclein-2 isoform X2 [Protopterus annectens]